MINIIERLTRFGLVGSLAMLVHWLTVALICSYNIVPAYANILGFIAAFQVSYFGHCYWTFATDSIISHPKTVSRFFIISSFSFILNQFLYIILLHYTSLNYLVALAIVLLSVSIVTFVTSSMWVFK
ncbi:MAG: GtrA family protein [Gammaproteobacteria bacterium]|nr:GtrA family protein [Gammaproteobacteria bacterium]